MHRIIAALACAITPAMAVPTGHATNMTKSQKLFTDEVAAILKEHCVRCHGGEKTKSGLNLTTRETLLTGGDHGAAIVAGNSAESLLYQVAAHLDKDLAMPPKKPKLPEETLATLAKWIDLGAAYAEPLVDKATGETGPMQVTAKDRAWWAYAPLSQISPPDAPEDWSDTAIDRFIAAGHRATGLTPAGPIEKRSLIRRAFFDLIGLPPTPEEIARFVASTDSHAYEQLLDELLARPAYGERWARHWLDVARFAESHGFEHDYDRKFAFHYRDFVIRSLNADLPYDQFVKWQIAGDEIDPDNHEAMAATGFLGAGVYPTQITINEAERVRYDALDDMIATMGSAMLATTIGCARCHDHKYDPIPTRDYYELLSAFTTTVRSEIELETHKPERAEFAEFEAELAALQSEAARYRKEDGPAKLKTWLAEHDGKAPAAPPPPWTILRAETLVSSGGATFEPLPDGSYLATGTNPDYDTYTFTSAAPFDGIHTIRIEALAHDSMVQGGPGRAGNGNIALTDLQVMAGETPLQLANPRSTFDQSGVLHVSKTIDGDAKSAWAVDPQFGKDHAAVYEVVNSAAANGTLTVTLKFENNTRHNIGRLRVAVSTRPAPDLPLLEGGNDPGEAAARELASLAAQTMGAITDEMLTLYLSLDAGWADLQARTRALEATRPAGRKETVMVCSEGFKPMRHHTSSGSIPDFYPETYYLQRGDPAKKNGVAIPGFLHVLMRDGATSDRWRVVSESGGRTSLQRLGVANWITDVEQGGGHLLARVIVNRLWQHHFGRGIVATPDDFGFQGERPTHPELLDYLADDLIEHGWTLKRLHKQIMLSRTYQLGRSANPSNEAIDPENHLWWKRDPQRTEAEVIRDNALAVSGLLDRTMYGPGTLEQDMKRRSIYFFVKRSQLVPVMQLFDWPDTMSSQGRRAGTTTPSQALIFVNSPEVREMAVHFAASVASGKDPVGTAVQRALGRFPTGPERALMNTFLQEQIDSYGGDGQAALVDFCQVLLASNEMIYVE